MGEELAKAISTECWHNVLSKRCSANSSRYANPAPQSRFLLNQCADQAEQLGVLRTASISDQKVTDLHLRCLSPG
jgi:hypothetical protein